MDPCRFCTYRNDRSLGNYSAAIFSRVYLFIDAVQLNSAPRTVEPLARPWLLALTNHI